MFHRRTNQNHFARILLALVTVATLIGGLFVDSVMAYGGTFALNFDGNNDAVQVGALDSAMTILPDCQNTKSIALWVRPLGNADPALETGMADHIFGDHPRWWGISRGIVGGLDRIWVWNFDDNGDSIQVPYTSGEWMHLVLVHGGGVLRAYKNGIEVGAVASGASGSNSCHTLSFGGGITLASAKFQGQIDELSIWGKVLSAAEIRDIMNHELVGDEPNLEAYFMMSDGSGTSVTDDSLNAYSGTFVGSPDWVASGALEGPDHALDFDGVDDTVQVPASISMSPYLTLEAWIYPRDLSSGQKWIVGEEQGAQLTMDGSTAQFRIHDGVALRGPATAEIQAGVWQHVAGTFDGATLEIYVNGVQGNNFDFLGSNSDRGNLFTFATPDGLSQMNNIVIEEVRLWDTARSADQIRTDMFHSLAGDELNLIAYYRFDQSSGDPLQTTLLDITGNNNDGNLIGMDPALDWVISSAFNTWIGADSASWSAPGNWSKDMVPIAGDHTGIYLSTLANNPTITTMESVKQLYIDAGSTLMIDGGSLYVPGSVFNQGTLVNHGTIAQTLLVNGGEAVQFVGGTYGGLALNPNGDDLGAVTVSIRGNQDCTDVPGETVLRCFDVASTVAPVTGATITFFYDAIDESGNNCDQMQAYHWQSSSWQLLTLDSSYGIGGRSCGANPRSIRVTGVTGFSPFVLKSTSAPTAIRLTNFSASGPVTGFNVFVCLLALGFIFGATAIHRNK